MDKKNEYKSLYFVRHGQSEWNVLDKICGSTDVPLTAKGVEQAGETAKLILDSGVKADAILYSPLERARETALIISKVTGIPAREEKRLFEQNFGKWEGTSPRNREDFKADKRQFVNHYGTGESMLQMAQRIYNLLDELADDSRIYILVAHNGIARVVKSYFEDMTNEEYASFSVKNCSLNEFRFAAKKYEFYGAYAEGIVNLKPVPQAETVWGAIKNPIDMYDYLSKTWCEYTCAPRMRLGWTRDNMTLGQCSITAFLVQDIFGGKVYGVPRSGGNFHCFNVIDGVVFDLTSEQFAGEVLDYENCPEQFREVHFEKEEKRLRYEYLKEKFRCLLQNA